MRRSGIIGSDPGACEAILTILKQYVKSLINGALAAPDEIKNEITTFMKKYNPLDRDGEAELNSRRKHILTLKEVDRNGGYETSSFKSVLMKRFENIAPELFKSFDKNKNNHQDNDEPDGRKGEEEEEEEEEIEDDEEQEKRVKEDMNQYEKQWRRWLVGAGEDKTKEDEVVIIGEEAVKWSLVNGSKRDEDSWRLTLPIYNKLS